MDVVLRDLGLKLFPLSLVAFNSSISSRFQKQDFLRLYVETGVISCLLNNQGLAPDLIFVLELESNDSSILTVCFSSMNFAGTILPLFSKGNYGGRRGRKGRGGSVMAVEEGEEALRVIMELEFYSPKLTVKKP